MHITLNLLPPAKKKALHMGLVMSSIQMMVFILFVFGILISGTMFSLRLMLQHNFDTVKAQTAVISSGPVEVQAAIKDINTYLDKIELDQKSFIIWSQIIEDIGNLVPAGAKVTKLTVGHQGDINLSGTAQTRADALLLLENLEQAPYLSDVVSPLSNILQKHDVNFRFQMKYLPPTSDEPTNDEAEDYAVE